MKISIKDFATAEGISYEAARKQVARYEEQLNGHITVENKMRMLDDDAQAFLREKRQINPVAIYDQSKDEQIKNLTAETDSLRIQLMEAQQAIIQLQKSVMENNEIQLRLTETKAQLTVLESERDQARAAASNADQAAAQARADADQAHTDAIQARNDANQARQAADQARADAAAYVPFIFGLFRRKK